MPQRNANVVGTLSPGDKLIIYEERKMRTSNANLWYLISHDARMDSSEYVKLDATLHEAMLEKKKKEEEKKGGGKRKRYCHQASRTSSGLERS